MKLPEREVRIPQYFAYENRFYNKNKLLNNAEYILIICSYMLNYMNKIVNNN